MAKGKAAPAFMARYLSGVNYFSTMSAFVLSMKMRERIAQQGPKSKARAEVLAMAGQKVLSNEQGL